MAKSKPAPKPITCPRCRGTRVVKLCSEGVWYGQRVCADCVLRVRVQV